MKRTKFIIGAMVLSMGLLGTGYAYWTDSLSVGATVSTGKFDINFEADQDSTEAYETVDGHFIETPYIEDVKIEVKDGSAMNISAKNIYPGSLVRFAYSVKNNSTIPMVLESVEVDAPTDLAANEGLKVYIQAGGEQFYGKGDSLEAKIADAFKQAYGEVAKDQYTSNEDAHFLTIVADGEALDNEKFAQGTELKADIEFNWTQKNNK